MLQVLIAVKIFTAADEKQNRQSAVEDTPDKTSVNGVIKPPPLAVKIDATIINIQY